jgi:TNF receptor-associated protein 1
MTKDELIQNLGTIAHSGSAEFMKSLNAGEGANIIGQFGVGFYSTFMVGKQVKVFSRSAEPGSQGYVWISDG